MNYVNFPIELSGQLVLGNITDHKGKGSAIFLNITGVFLSSAITLFVCSCFRQRIFSVPYTNGRSGVWQSSARACHIHRPHPQVYWWRLTCFGFLDPCASTRPKHRHSQVISLLSVVQVPDWPELAQGCFLLLHWKYCPFVLLSETTGTALVKPLLQQSDALPFVLSIICCLLAYAMGIVYLWLQPDSNSIASDEQDDPATQRLLVGCGVHHRGSKLLLAAMQSSFNNSLGASPFSVGRHNENKTFGSFGIFCCCNSQGN